MRNYYPLYKESDIKIGKSIIVEAYAVGFDTAYVKGVVKDKYDGFVTVVTDKGYHTCVNFIKNI